jgi:hypothetical protein
VPDLVEVPLQPYKLFPEQLQVPQGNAQFPLQLIHLHQFVHRHQQQMVQLPGDGDQWLGLTNTFSKSKMSLPLYQFQEQTLVFGQHHSSTAQRQNVLTQPISLSEGTEVALLQVVQQTFVLHQLQVIQHHLTWECVRLTLGGKVAQEM